MGACKKVKKNSTVQNEMQKYFKERGLYVACPDDRERLSLLLSQSFSDYPLMRYFSGPDISLISSFFDIETQAMEGVCMTIADSEDMNSVLSFSLTQTGEISLMKYLKCGMQKLTKKMGVKKSVGMVVVLGKMETLMQKYKSPQDFYVRYLATAPDMQKKGLATHLMKTFQQFADENNRGVYLETFLETDSGIYQRMGFELKEKVEMKDGSGLKMYAMYYNKVSQEAKYTLEE